ncbi:cytochrome b/b6 domain-containing protein [Pseudovibrio exalbescens]|uniref:cytochrome b n=1 Tax=Pseudovibrio exalbescens TaxID=197461 RepID=UPI002366BCCA|nr:cytochrome b/b6 domain-containing protein [Pseudovibrio exalbescens]MDD7910903.1 cytochrome b/b6 domain-containing protein [Pseudovibrio exalbescens]
MKSTPNQYGTVAVTLHWLSAAVIVALLTSGFLSGYASSEVARKTILAAHVPMGLGILVLTVLRIGWWLVADRKPAPAQEGNALQNRLARIVHTLTYVLILFVCISGIGMMALTGAADVLFDVTAGPLPDFTEVGPRAGHGLGVRLLMGLLALHVVAALYHHFLRKDQSLARMWYLDDKA